MHELSIALKLVELACDHAAAYGDSEVAAVHVAVGVLAQVHTPSLRRGFEIAAMGSPLAQAELVIRTVPLMIACATCKCDLEVDGLQDLRCPRCHGDSTMVRHGSELDLESISLRPRQKEVASDVVSSSEGG